MNHSSKLQILDLDHSESIIEQEITAAEAVKIVGGGGTSPVDPIDDPPGLPCFWTLDKKKLIPG
ncbi:hypothetical protein [Fischerella sp. PCC 9605]|uniref:hypothetical protein n=1 Tax=Fischerella sp. PCC 9605 TaxID=1173024 RepID=UPI00047E7B87|nr:hypothetical protein [Fischerella sp. PCC 9605]